MKSDLVKFKDSVFYSLAFIALLWIVKAIEFSVSGDFGDYGILPRKISGAIGIITGPLIHGDFNHLFSNTIPLLILGIGVIYFYNKIAFEVIALIYLMTGVWVWIAAREAYHIGASGIVYGMVSFLFFSGVFRKDPKSIAVSLVVTFLLGGMVYGIFPTNENISWESHLLGSLAGVFCAFYFRSVQTFDHNKGKAELVVESVRDKELKHTLNSDLSDKDISFQYDFVPSKATNNSKEEKTATNTKPDQDKKYVNTYKL
ncbi:rhomboid family intramembrane serine protease [Fulvivirgaceae bacterium BMA12]|uniref:Rhomboid family intramembrane serine protease n=1 Tax=Agaribacillus aureus TaxID=3051825 RepID=A0ABT8L7V4_9BACT|nr:rhomboid family intramembrane serine protease [Fulvivirgaceae bacterium BMA12]